MHQGRIRDQRTVGAFAPHLRGPEREQMPIRWLRPLAVVQQAILDEDHWVRVADPLCGNQRLLRHPGHASAPLPHPLLPHRRPQPRPLPPRRHPRRPQRNLLDAAAPSMITTSQAPMTGYRRLTS